MTRTPIKKTIERALPSQIATIKQKLSAIDVDFKEEIYFGKNTLVTFPFGLQQQKSTVEILRYS